MTNEVNITFTGYKPVAHLHWDTKFWRTDEERKELAKDQVRRGITAALRNEGIFEDEITWLSAYDEVADWLQDNKEKGLFLCGDCGTGKTLLARHVLIPILKFLNPVPSYKGIDHQTNIYWGNARDMAELVKEGVDLNFSEYGVIMIDDIGTESVSFNYGERVNAFFELVDYAERFGKFLVITSNLTKQEIIEKYGERTLDRLRKLCRLVQFKGESLRV